MRAVLSEAHPKMMVPKLHTFDEALDGRKNRGTFVRFCAATLVSLSHTYILTGHPVDEPIAKMFTFLDGGALGVLTFFALSGFLITKSWCEHPDAMRFIEARALRIIPGLLFAAVLTAWGLGAITTTAALHNYLLAVETREYVPCTLVFLETCRLPGVFPHTIVGPEINGSLWTLPVEVFLYTCVLAAGLGRIANSPARMVAVVLLLLICDYFYSDALLALVPKQSSPITSRLVGAFFCGALIYSLKNIIPCSFLLCIPIVGVAIALVDTRFFPYAFVATFSYIVLVIVFRPGPKLAPPQWIGVGDYSYGIYVLSFPIQQTVLSLTSLDRPMMLFAVAYPLTLALAAFSWHVIERPALRWKGRLAVTAQRGESV